MAAHNPALTQLLAALNAAPHAGMGNDFFAHVGSSLALARSVPPEWFPRSGTATAAQIGGLIARLHTLTTVAWAAYPLNGANDMTSWMIGNGSLLLDAINKACAAQGFAHGSGTMHPEIQAKTMLNYTDVLTAVSHNMWVQFVQLVEVDDLIQAEVLVSSGTDWARLMSRAITFAETTAGEDPEGPCVT